MRNVETEEEKIKEILDKRFDNTNNKTMLIFGGVVMAAIILLVAGALLADGVFDGIMNMLFGTDEISDNPEIETNHDTNEINQPNIIYKEDEQEASEEEAGDEDVSLKDTTPYVGHEAKPSASTSGGGRRKKYPGFNELKITEVNKNGYVNTRYVTLEYAVYNTNEMEIFENNVKIKTIPLDCESNVCKNSESIILSADNGDKNINVKIKNKYASQEQKVRFKLDTQRPAKVTNMQAIQINVLRPEVSLLWTASNEEVTYIIYRLLEDSYSANSEYKYNPFNEGINDNTILDGESLVYTEIENLKAGENEFIPIVYDDQTGYKTEPYYPEDITNNDEEFVPVVYDDPASYETEPYNPNRNAQDDTEPNDDGCDTPPNKLIVIAEGVKGLTYNDMACYGRIYRYYVKAVDLADNTSPLSPAARITVRNLRFDYDDGILSIGSAKDYDTNPQY